MTKKKVKRVDPRRTVEGGFRAKWQRFHETGAPFSLAMLLLFVVLVSEILCVGGPEWTQQGRFSWMWSRSVLQTAGIVFMLSLPMGFYVAAYEPRLVKNHLRGLLIFIMLVAMIALVRVIVVRAWPQQLILVPVMVLAIMLTVGYSQRFALGLGAFAAVMAVMALRSENLGLLLSTWSGVGVAVLSLKEIRSRSRLIEVCLLAGFIVAAMVWAVGFWRDQPWHNMLLESLWGGGAALAVGFLMQGLLPLVERLFGTATSMTLRDFSEANKPLLKRLAVAAPGTFNHSWQIGMLSEAAADAIGANGLLCRVGSYYPDVGKLNKPRYFVENQAENFNQHRELSPTMSRMIIIGHVKDGLELAREYRLPQVLHQFIASHHGTTLVAYFYHEAAKKGAELGHSVPETEFRYPGPKPHTKEAAIVMLADAVEGATRAMQDPTPSRIEAVVKEVAFKRLQDGQLDQCDMTMRELKQIESSLIKSLCGMYHGRIAYPKTESAETNGRPEAAAPSDHGPTDNDNNDTAAAEPTPVNAPAPAPDHDERKDDSL